MSVTLLRSNIEFAKRVFLDRLTTDAQPLLQPTQIDQGPGDEYEYAGTFDPFNFGIGADCSGLCGIVLGAAINGAAAMTWGRLFSTETFPGPLPGFRQTTQADLINGSYPLKVCIMHGGGGPDSHMACQIDGWDMESNGDHGVCTMPGDITGTASSYWNDWWVYDAPITEDTTRRQPMSYPRGLDYAGGRPSGADLAAAGISFVCRYVTDGGSGLPNKILTAAEFADLQANNIAVVFNWEQAADNMLGGAAQGTTDAQAALANIRSLPGAPSQPVVYFSCDFDSTPDQQTPINAYLQAAAQVLGGSQFVGIYGGFWPLSRALDAGVCKYGWQTEAWSGGNVDSRINIMQRNGLGYQTVDGVQCDINEAHTDDIGAVVPNAAPPTPTPPPTPTQPDPTAPAFLAGLSDRQVLNLIAVQLLGPDGLGWAQGGADSDAIAELEAKVAAGGPLTPVDLVSWLKHHASTHKAPTP